MSLYLASVLTNMVLISFLALSAYVVLIVGEVSFGQQAFFGIGAYVAATITALLHGNIVVALVAGALAGAAMAALLAILTIRLSGFYFSIASLSFAEMFRLSLLLVRYPEEIDGRQTGPNGPEGFENIRWIFDNNITVQEFLILASICLLALLAAMLWLERRELFRNIRLVGDDSVLAQSLGIRPNIHRIAMIAVSGCIAGFGGGLFAHYNSYVEPAMFGVMLGVHGIAYAIIGGLGTPIGPLIGVAFDIGLLESVRVLSEYRMIAFGGLVAVFIIFRPDGLISPRLVARFRRSLSKRDA